MEAVKAGGMFRYRCAGEQELAATRNRAHSVSTMKQRAPARVEGAQLS